VLGLMIQAVCAGPVCALQERALDFTSSAYRARVAAQLDAWLTA
jgi:hypothetical protein